MSLKNLFDVKENEIFPVETATIFKKKYTFTLSFVLHGYKYSFAASFVLHSFTPYFSHFFLFT